MMLGLSLSIGGVQGPRWVEDAVSGSVNSDSSTFAVGMHVTPTSGTTDSDSATFGASRLFLTFDASAATWASLHLLSKTAGQADPLGGTGAVKITEASDTSQQHGLNATGLTAPGATYTMDVWLQPGTGNNRHWFDVNIGSSFSKFVDSAGTSTGSGAGTATRLLVVGAWELWRITGTWSAGTTNQLFLSNETPAITYNGDGASHAYVFRPLCYTA